MACSYALHAFSKSYTHRHTTGEESFNTHREGEAEPRDMHTHHSCTPQAMLGCMKKAVDHLALLFQRLSPALLSVDLAYLESCECDGQVHVGGGEVVLEVDGRTQVVEGRRVLASRQVHLQHTQHTRYAQHTRAHVNSHTQRSAFVQDLKGPSAHMRVSPASHSPLVYV
jgi:hypothetical protein